MFPLFGGHPLDVKETGRGSNKEYEEYQQYQTDKLYGRILTPDGLGAVCAGMDNDPEKIGIRMLEMLVKFRNEGIVERRLAPMSR